MDRFPMLTTYRGILQILAILVILIGFFASISFAQEAADDEWNSRTREYDEGFSFSAFIGSAVVFAGIALSLLVTAEFIQLALTIEDHLYKIQSESTGKAPEKSRSKLMDL